MNAVRKIVTLTFAAVLAVATLETGASLGIPGIPGFSSEAHAEIGRPLTPLSIAGVGRRTVRRCAVGIYDC